MEKEKWYSISVKGSFDKWTWSCHDKGWPYHETRLKICKNGLLCYCKLVRHDFDDGSGEIYKIVTPSLVSRFIRRYGNKLEKI